MGWLLYAWLRTPHPLLSLCPECPCRVPFSTQIPGCVLPSGTLAPCLGSTVTCPLPPGLEEVTQRGFGALQTVMPSDPYTPRTGKDNGKRPPLPPAAVP